MPVPATAQDKLAETLLECNELGEDAARLACFDDIAESLDAQRTAATDATPTQQPQPAPSPQANPAPPPPAPVDDIQPKPLTDEVGQGALSGDERPREIYSATVTRCEHNRRLNEFFLVLSNDQVWKMSNFRRPIVGECQFDVTIEKDFFGFRMSIPSKDMAFRVSRVH